jgi:predicted nucleic acid-binding Zn ribbon protein
MPTYVYKFIESGETIEIHQAFSDDTLTEATHPTTGAVMSVKKVFLPVGVTFKGGGFYKTDSRGGSGTKSTTATAPTSSDSSSDSSSSSNGSSDSSSGSSTTSATPAAPAAASTTKAESSSSSSAAAAS